MCTGDIYILARIKAAVGNRISPPIYQDLKQRPIAVTHRERTDYRSRLVSLALFFQGKKDKQGENTT